MRRGTDRGRTRTTVAKWVQKETGDSVHLQSPIGADRLTEEVVRGKDGSSIGKRNSFQQMSHSSAPKHSEYKPKFVSKNRQEGHSHGGIQEIGADRLAEEAVRGKDGSSIGKRNNFQQMSHGSAPKHSEYKPKFVSKNKLEWHSHGGIQEVGADRLAGETVSGEDGSSIGKRNNSQQMSQGIVPKNSDSITLQDDLPHQAAPSNEGASLKVDVESKLKTSVHLVETQIGADRLAEETVGGEDGSFMGNWNNSQQMSHGSVPKHFEYKLKFGSKNRQEWHSHGGIQEVGADRLAEETIGGEDGSSIGKRNSSQQMSQGSVLKNSRYKPKLGSKNRQEWHSHGGNDGFANIVMSQQGINSPESVGSRSKQFKCMRTPDSAHKQDFPQLSGWSDSEDLDAGRIQSGKILSVGTADSITLQDDLQNQAAPSNKGASLEVNMEFKLKISVQVETQVLSVSAKKYEPSSSKDPKSSAGHKNLEHSEHSAMLDSFDLYPTKSEKTVKLKPPLLVQNRERWNEIKSSSEGQNGIVLRAGMVLLKSYISLSDQVKIVKKCRDLGMGPGGFYQPGYRDGAKLRLKMMCLGKNWDPETGNYGDHRPVDEAKPPTIPAEFYQLVKKSIEDSHSLIQKNSKSSNVESILPWMSPNICRVNYYSENGRLGLQQDRDESQESLAKGLPVVSFSIGDKADFLYGDQRNVDKAEKVVLESGDVLIFGGKSRHIFHGVTAIHPNSAPKSLLEETKLRPGRLNLTFRQY